MRPFAYSNYIDINGKRVLYLNEDNPSKAYETNDLCFVAQPILDAESNKKCNVVTIPLMMTDEWDILQKYPTRS